MNEAALALRAQEIHTTEFEQAEEAYSLSPFAAKFLGKITYDDVETREFTPSDAGLLADGILRLRGPMMAKANAHDYPALMRSLLSPESTARNIAEEVLGGSEDKSAAVRVHNALRSVVAKCQKAAPKGVSIDRLIQLGNPEYQPPVKQEVARNLGTSAAVAVVFTPMEHGPVVQRALEDYPYDEPLAWQADGLCAQTDPEAFFPEKGGSSTRAKKICAECEVQSICLQYALENNERFGIWGGHGERERRNLRKDPQENVA